MPTLPFWSHPPWFPGRLRAGAAGAKPARAGRPGTAPASLLIPSAAHGPLLVEALDASAAAAHKDAWIDLVGRGLEPNVFLEPSFAIPAAQMLAAARPPIFILVWVLRPSGGRDLVAVCPFAPPRAPFRRTAQVWFHDLAALGFPLLDRRCAGAAFGAILAWIGRRAPGCRALFMTAVPADGPTAKVLHGVADDTGRRFVTFDPRQRAMLRGGVPEGGVPRPALSRRRAKELNRQRRRLGEQGPLRYAGAADGEALRSAVEHFLALEAKGWKGARGTALLMNPSRAAFARAMTRLLARENKCRVESLTIGDVPVAIGIVLSSGGRDFFWKMAYDEAFAAASPGVQLVRELTDRQARHGSADAVDSCAAPDHPMIDRLWRDRLNIVDAAVAVTPGAGSGFAAAVARERARRRVKAVLKRLVRAWREARGTGKRERRISP